MRYAGWLLFLCGLFAVAFAQTGKDAKAVLQAIAKTYDGAKTVVGSGTFTRVIKSPTMETKITGKFQVLAQKPNKVKAVTEMPTPQGQTLRQLAVSDGTNMFIEFPQLKQTLKRPAPKEGGKVDLPFGEQFMGQFSDFLAKVKEAKFAGREKVGKRTAQVIKTTMDDGTVVNLWVADNKVWQVKVVMEGAKMAAKTPPSPQGRPDPFVEAMKQMTITVIIVFDKVQLNAKIPAETFTYKLPSGFKFVEKLEMPSPPKSTP